MLTHYKKILLLFFKEKEYNDRKKSSDLRHPLEKNLPPCVWLWDRKGDVSKPQRLCLVGFPFVRRACFIFYVHRLEKACSW